VYAKAFVYNILITCDDTLKENFLMCSCISTVFRKMPTVPEETKKQSKSEDLFKRKNQKSQDNNEGKNRSTYIVVFDSGGIVLQRDQLK
jgi:hypothetical protein